MCKGDKPGTVSGKLPRVYTRPWLQQLSWILLISLLMSQVTLAFIVNVLGTRASMRAALPLYLLELLIVPALVAIFIWHLRIGKMCNSCLNVILGFLIAVILFSCFSGFIHGLSSSNYTLRHTVNGFTYGARYLDRSRMYWYQITSQEGPGVFEATVVLGDLPRNASTYFCALATAPYRELYDGPFPTFDEAVKLINSQPVPIEYRPDDEPWLFVDGRPLVIEHNRWAISAIAYYAKSSEATATIIDDRLAVIGCRYKGDFWEVILVDMETNTGIARLYKGY